MRAGAAQLQCPAERRYGPRLLSMRIVLIFLLVIGAAHAEPPKSTLDVQADRLELTQKSGEIRFYIVEAGLPIRYGPFWEIMLTEGVRIGCL